MFRTVEEGDSDIQMGFIESDLEVRVELSKPAIK